MDIVSTYLSKHAYVPTSIKEQPNADLRIVVVIPAFNEELLIPSLTSLWDCTKPDCSVEIIIVINASNKSPASVIKQNKKLSKELKLWNPPHNTIRLHILEFNDLPDKISGVGLARKIGMDEAVRRFQPLAHDGIIVCFDADCQCDKNYFVAIEKHFVNNPDISGCSIYFEHPLDGELYEKTVYKGIVLYELYLRYYRLGLQYAGLPFAYHTVGSALAVSCSAYCRLGGMNKRKAGEDFYFIQKLIKSGNYSDLKTTCVYPSPRPSERVPFGTGKAIINYGIQGNSSIKAPPVEMFNDLKILNRNIENIFHRKTVITTIALDAYFKEIAFEKRIDEIIRNTSTLQSFRKRFYRWFDALMVLKFIHFSFDSGYYVPQDVHSVATELLTLHIGNRNKFENVMDLLQFYRDFEKGN